MKHRNLETVLKLAYESWEKDPINKGNEKYINSFLLGWLKQAYTNVYNDLPENKKA